MAQSELVDGLLPHEVNAPLLCLEELWRTVRRISVGEVEDAQATLALKRKSRRSAFVGFAPPLRLMAQLLGLGQDRERDAFEDKPSLTVPTSAG
jgi:hypothetical protein